MGESEKRREERRSGRDGHGEDRKDRDILAKEQPVVLESAADDPIFPAMSEFEVDEGGPKGSTKKHPGAPWFALAIVAVVVLVVFFMAIGDWFW